MITVGLTGGIGSGKSLVSRLLESRGAVVVDADVVAREVVAPGTDGLAAVAEAFGEGVLAPDGSLDRTALAARVFADPGERRRLEAIVHPLVGRRMRALTADLPADAVVVHDVPLLVENDLAGQYDVVVVVDVPEATQLDRLVRLRGMAPDDARARIAAQADPARRRAAADVVLDNSGPVAALEAQVSALWERLRAATSGG